MRSEGRSVILGLWRTPRRFAWIVVYAAAALALIPLVTRITTTLAYYRGAYPPEGDAIIIAFMESMALALLFLPYLAILLVLASIRYNPGTSVLRLNRSLWELVAVLGVLPGFAFRVLEAGYWLDRYHFPISAAHVVMMCVLLVVRAAISNKRPRLQQVA